jgi:uncharacterized protein (DUF1778 family)
MSRIIFIRVAAAELQIIRNAARKRGLSIPRFIIEAACKAATQVNRNFASLHIDPDYRMPQEASRSRKSFIRQRIKRP